MQDQGASTMLKVQLCGSTARLPMGEADFIHSLDIVLLNVLLNVSLSLFVTLHSSWQLN
jgi:hypothetical protein